MWLVVFSSNVYWLNLKKTFDLPYFPITVSIIEHIKCVVSCKLIKVNAQRLAFSLAPSVSEPVCYFIYIWIAV